MAFVAWRNWLAQPAVSTYLRDSARPLASLAFILPMLALYEGALCFLGPDALRNGAEVWLREGLRIVGLGQPLLLPLLTCGALLAWHQAAGDPWRFSPWVLMGMVAESALVALALVGLVHVQAMLFRESPASAAAAMQDGASHAGQLIGYCGAGIYEELLFRLFLLTALAGLLHSLGTSRATGLVAAALATSLMFAAAHYRFVTPFGEPFDAFTFGFRFVAGLAFSSLFIGRGFGVAAGAHALYDIFVVTL